MSLGGAGSDIAYDITLDNSNNAYIVGTFSQTVDFDLTAGEDLRTSAGDKDIFIMKIDSNGNQIWSKTLGGPGADIGVNVELDEQRGV